MNKLNEERPIGYLYKNDAMETLGCGCRMWHVGKDVALKFCPMHAAADDLLAALEDIRARGYDKAVTAAIAKATAQGKE